MALSAQHTESDRWGPAARRAFLATNLALLGLIAEIFLQSIVSQGPKWAGASVQWLAFSLVWQSIILVLLGVLWLQATAILALTGEPISRRPWVAARGGLGWIAGGAVFVLWTLARVDSWIDTVLPRADQFTTGVTRLTLPVVVGFAASSLLMLSGAGKSATSAPSSDAD